MSGLRKSAGWGLAVASLALLVGAVAWIGSLAPRIANDYEDCAEEARADATSTIEYSRLIIHCGERYAGRRKAGGGYTYFDFMQNRNFDIVGPNPTEEERKRIDRSYMEFLARQRSEDVLSDLAKAPASGEPADLSVHSEPGSALDPTSKIPLPVKRPRIVRSKVCEGASLSCSWVKLSAAVRDAFASVGAGR